MACVCDSICEAIAALPHTCAVEEVEEALEPLFQSLRENGEIAANDKGITPLLVACDKGNVACLEYLRNKLKGDASPWLSNCLGTPSGRSTREENTAMHHAAMAGCTPAISILFSFGVSALALGSARNSHRDTPLMMAATSGHLDFCKAWHELCISSVNGKVNKDLLEVWEGTNDSNDSCLSLACGHGQVEVVKFLLSSNCGVSIGSDTVIQCQNQYQRMNAALRCNPSLSQTHRDQAERVQLCLEMLQAEIAQIAELAAQELLRSEDIIVTMESSGATKAKSKPRKKNKARRNAQEPRTISDESSLINVSGQRVVEKGDTVQLTTLLDGRKAVCVEGTSPLPTVAGQDRMIPVSRTQRSADEMFRERFQQGHNISSEVDAVMQALCLDMSMLLYTPHGMAIDLSPSQLDAVEDILRGQLEAVSGARAIQERLHTTSQQSRPPVEEERG